MARRIPALALLFAGLLCVPAPASAQIAVAKSLDLSSVSATTVPVPAPAARPVFESVGVVSADAAQRGNAGVARHYLIRAFAGFWLGSGDGIELGGGVSARPFRDAKHELQGNAYLLRVERQNAFSIDADYLYNFRANNVGDFTPYAGAGLIVTFPSGGDSDAGIQIGGGLKKPLSNGMEFFGELYFAFVFDTPVILRAGIGW